MRGQRATLLLLLVLTVLASLLTAERSLRRRARFRGNPGLGSDNAVQVLLLFLIKIVLLFLILTDRTTEPVQRCVQGGKTEVKNERKGEITTKSRGTWEQ